ncbi:MAG TPA: hypothetical protein VMU37_01245 [Caulobacteraceae bacterium]|nr:hypothetical protein [Caulobacteraceae bacterium]
MRVTLRICLRLALGAALAAGVAAPVAQADQDDVLAWSQTAARGLYELCRADAPDAAKVVELGEVWGWPRFMGYLEHPDGYKREAGGESRRTYQDGDLSAYVDATVQSGEVTSAAPAHIQYFRCNMDSDQPVDADLARYFTERYGAPASKTGAATVWLGGAAKSAAPVDDDAALKAVIAAGAGAEGLRIELSRDEGRDRATFTLFRDTPAS